MLSPLATSMSPSPSTSAWRRWLRDAHRRPPTATPLLALLLLLALAAAAPSCAARISSDMTSNVFGENAATATAGIVAAFGDFNSDELTDVFALRSDKHTLEILLGADVEPLLRPGPRCEFRQRRLTSVVPGDFDGDAYMDVLVTVQTDDPLVFDVFVNWGGSDTLNCSSAEAEPLLRIRGEPLALDYNRDMIIDLFGVDAATGARTFWVFAQGRQRPTAIRMALPADLLPPAALSHPHSHAYLDLNGDFMADLFLTTETHFEVWLGQKVSVAEGGAEYAENSVEAALLAGDKEQPEQQPFAFAHKVLLPTGTMKRHIGQSLFLDVELAGQLNQVLPICFDAKCHNSTLLVWAGDRFHDLQVNFKDGANAQWGFIPPIAEHEYLSAISLRGGDFNMDGYPDLLVTLAKTNGGGGGWFSATPADPGPAEAQTFLMENVPCTRANCGPLKRTFEVHWRALAPFANGTVAGAFYDFYQDGILDVIFVEHTVPKSTRLVAFRNLLDYDANFVKCIVLTGLTNRRDPTRLTPLGRKKRTYGTNLPGPRIEYQTTTQEGDAQQGTSAQIPQSAHFSLQLPYTIFGLGRTPNFVEKLTVGLANESRTLSQVIPNSQMIVVPYPLHHPQGWKVQLFVTPSKLILKSLIALCGMCLLIMSIILGLYIKEKREDKVERLQAAHRFHFDAM